MGDEGAKADEVLLAEIERLKESGKIARIPIIHITMLRCLFCAMPISGLATFIIGGPLAMIGVEKWEEISIAMFFITYVIVFLTGLFEEIDKKQ